MSIYTELHGGTRWHLDGSKTNTITIEQIAHSLSLQCRWHGSCSQSFTVLQHSIMCADIAQLLGYDERTWYDCLMHDAHEAVIGDITSPIKRAIELFGGGEALRRVDDLARHGIEDIYGNRHTSEVHECDLIALKLEAEALLYSGGDWCDVQVSDCVRDNVNVLSYTHLGKDDFIRELRRFNP